MKKFLLALFASLAISAARSEVLSINQFGGINTDDNSITLTEGQTPDSLNVVTDDGPGLQGRKGTIQFSTQVCVDLWEFPNTNGTRYMICRSTMTGTLVASNGDSTFDIAIGTVPTDRKTVGSALGDRFYYANTLDGLKYWNTTSVVVASASLTVDKLVTAHGRLWAAGKSGSERTVFVSEYLDGTEWTTPSNPTVDSATQFTVSGGLDDSIQGLYATFRNTVVWYTRQSFGAFYGTNRNNFSQRTYSDRVGLASSESIQDCAGLLRWLAPGREIWEFDGANFYKISEQVDDLLANMKQGDSASRSTTLTTQSDWELGSHTPSGNLSTTISVGSVVLSTMVATTQTDTSAAEFGAGTLTDLSSTTLSGSLSVTLGSQSSREYFSNLGACVGLFYNSGQVRLAQQFTATTNYILTAVSPSMAIDAGSPGSVGIVRIYSDNGSNQLGSILVSESFTMTTGTHTLSTPVSVTGGTKYWVWFESSNSFDEFNTWCWNGESGSFSERFYDGSVYVTNVRAYLQTIGKQYATNGSIVSRAFDVGTTTDTWLYNWGSFSASTNAVPSGTTLTYETQSSADSTTWDSLVSVTIGATPSSTVRRYLRYKASFTTNQTTSPVLNSVTLSAGPFLKSSGTYTSKVVEVGDNISQWGPVSWNGAITSGNGDIEFQVQSSTHSDIANFTAAGWVNATNNTIPSISTNPYVAFRSTFTATASTESLSLNDFTFSWNEGSTQRVASGFVSQRYWLAVATASLIENDAVFIYDKRKQWQKYDHHAESITRYVSNHYFSNDGGIFQADTGRSDAGVSISAYFRTRDHPLAGTDTSSAFDYLYMTTDNSDASLSTSFRVNAVPTDYSLASYQMNQEAGLQNFKLPFAVSEVTQGKFINVNWTVAGTEFWRIINGNLYYKPGLVPN